MNKWTRRSVLKWLWVGVIMASLRTIQAALHLAGAEALARGADAGFRALLPLARRDGPTPFPTPSEPPAGTATPNPTASGDPTFTPEALPSATPSATGSATTTPTVAPTPTLTATGVPGRQPRGSCTSTTRAPRTGRTPAAGTVTMWTRTRLTRCWCAA